MLRRTSVDSSITSWPATRATPLVGGHVAGEDRMVVVLPAP